MKKSIALIVVVVAMSTGTMLAQTSFGIRAGVNFQNLNGKNNGHDLENGLKTGVNVGVNAEMGIAPDFYFQPGLLFSTKGANDLMDLDDFSANINYLELPLNLVYKPMLGSGKLIAGFGPYFGYAISGKFKYDDKSEDIKFGNNTEDDLKPLDIGANLLFGYEFMSKISIQMNAQLGLVNLVPDGDSDNSVKNTGFGFSLGYRF
jgi:hypothetical protein